MANKPATPADALSSAAAALGRKGGAARSERKTAAARENGKRPKQNLKPFDQLSPRQQRRRLAKEQAAQAAQAGQDRPQDA